VFRLPESPRRHVIVGFQAGQLGANLDQPDSCTIGGVAATLVATSGTTGLAWKQIWIAAVPTGTTGTVAVVRSGGNMTHGIIHVWAAYDLVSASPVDAINGASGDPSTGDLVTPGGGIAVGHSTTGVAGTWTVGGLVKDAEGTGSGTGASVRWTAASKAKTANETLAVSFDQAAVNSFIAASFK